MFKNALVSVSNKSGLVEFLKPFAEQGMRIVSTGGTAQHLREAGFSVVDVSEQTGFSEVMDGRVKTLHPRVHMALLARKGHFADDSVLQAEGIEAFDLVIGNLYPFEEKLKLLQGSDDLIEFIDVGGPSFLRAAAKNFSRMTVICDPDDYGFISKKNGELSIEERRALAAKVFRHVSGYDSVIAEWMSPEVGSEWALPGEVVQALRYGENPQQQAWWFARRGEDRGLDEAQILQGKALSYNNLLDLDAAIQTVREFSGTKAAVSVKHNNPCGVAIGENATDVLSRALKADPVSVFGGIVAVNFTLGDAEAELVEALFLECLIAPAVTPEARERLARKKNFRVLEWSRLQAEYEGSEQVRSILGGFLVQTSDVHTEWSSQWKVLGEQPSEQIRQDLLLAWKIAKHLKSNAIAIAGMGQSLGLGMGQVNRVDAVEQAIQRWQKHHSHQDQAVLASDAFFPFADSIEQIAKAGIRWVIQPGGSLRDEEVTMAARELGVHLVLTGQRHFRH